MNYTTKVLIIGSGPAACSAAIYAARANLLPIMVCGDQPGGQLTITTDVENYPGFAHPIQGPALMDAMINQARNVGTQIIHDYIQRVDFSSKPFICHTKNDQYIADTVIISTGAAAQWLGLESEQLFRGYGVSGCATCDAFFFKNKPVLVVGGGNTAVEEALYLTKHANLVTLIHRRDSLRAEKILQDRLFANPKINVIWDHQLVEVTGDLEPYKMVKGAKIQHVNTGKITDISVDGIFIAIGHKPNTQIFTGQLDIDQEGYIKTVPGTTRTNITGVFAAGDVQDKVYRQAITAAGTGCMAALDAQKYLDQ